MASIYNRNQSRYDDYVFEDEGNEHEKTFVTVHADSLNEKEFSNFLNCLESVRESEKKRKGDKRVIKNYCVKVPYIDNSILVGDDEDGALGDEFENTCNEMKTDISQMFSVFEEDVHLNYDDYEVKSDKAAFERKQNPSESFREKFLRNRQKIKKMSESRVVDTKPIIRGMIKKPSAPRTPNTSLNKNQVDKIMNEFHRVKINYYSKENFVEFTDKDYFYCDSDVESMRSERVGKLNQNVLSKFEEPEEVSGKTLSNGIKVGSKPPLPGIKVGLKQPSTGIEVGRKSPSTGSEVDRKSPSTGIEVVPKNSVRDKINMFTKLDMIIRPCEGKLQKSISAPVVMKKEDEKKQKQSVRMQNIIKNTSATNKNQNKCFIKDINNSLLDEVKRDEVPIAKQKEELSAKMNRCSELLLDKISAYAQMGNVDLLMKLESTVNKFGMSLLHTIDGLMNDDAFTLVGNRMSHLNVETRPSIERFNETFDGDKIDSVLESIELSVIESSKIQLQMQVTVVNRATQQRDDVVINVIFMAQYQTGTCVTATPSVDSDSDSAAKTFYIFFTSLFEVL